MLDTHARHLVEPLIHFIARTLHRLGFTANTVTAAAMLVGVAAAACVVVDWNWTGIGLLWLSGLLDATDGAVARMGRANPFGAILDITFDRVVEVSMIFALAWTHPEARFVLVVLAGTIAIAMSLFLSIAATLRNESVKSFYYSPGLGERTEAFICLSLMIAGGAHLIGWTILFVGVMVITMAQRLRHVRLALSNATKP